MLLSLIELYFIISIYRLPPKGEKRDCWVKQLLESHGQAVDSHVKTFNLCSLHFKKNEINEKGTRTLLNVEKS